METKTLEHWNEVHMSKGDIFATLKAKGVEFDYALPQNWLEEVTAFVKKHQAEYPAVTYDLIRSTTVWAYPNDGQNYFMGKCITCCTEVEIVLTRFYHEEVNGNYKWTNTVKGKA